MIERFDSDQAQKGEVRIVCLTGPGAYYSPTSWLDAGDVLYAGETPRFPGLSQINFQATRVPAVDFRYVRTAQYARERLRQQQRHTLDTIAAELGLKANRRGTALIPPHAPSRMRHIWIYGAAFFPLPRTRLRRRLGRF